MNYPQVKPGILRNLTIAVTAALLPLIFCSAGKEKAERWIYVYHGAKPDSGKAVRGLSGSSVAALTGFSLRSDAAIEITETSLSGLVTRYCTEKNIRFYPVISFNSAKTGRKILNSAILRDLAVKNILSLALKKGCSGVHLDMEYLPAEDSLKLAAFCLELRSALKGIPLSMAVFPPEDFPAEWSSFHDLSILAGCLDEIVIMCYDYHRPGTPPGPVSSLSWAEKNIVSALRFFPADKIWLGVPAYGYRWTSSRRASAISAEKGALLARKYGSSRHHSGTMHIKYSTGGRINEIFFADYVMRNMMKELAERHCLKGIAVWRLGFEE